MTLAAPIWLALLALALPILWAYLRRPPVPRRIVSSLLLYRRLGLGSPPRRVRLRRWLSLALMLAALIVIAVGLAVGSQSDGAKVVVVLDDSASMGTITDGRTRWDIATTYLNRWISRHPGAEVTLLTTSPLRVRVDATRDHVRIREAVSALSLQGEGATVLLTACEGEHMLLLSDTIPAPQGCTVERPDLGEDSDNTGITALTVGSRDALGRAEVHVAVQATQPGPREVVLSVAGSTVETLIIDAPGSQSLTLKLTAGSELVARLTGNDALPSDDLATAPLGQGQRVRTLLVTSESRGFLTTALEAHPRVDLTIVTPDAVPNGTVDLLVLAAPVDTAPAARLTIMLDAGTGRPMASPHVTAVDSHDPAMEYVDLADLRIRRARPLALEGAHVLVDSDQGPLLVRRGSTIALGFRLADTDLALRVAFANLVANFIDETVPPVAPGQGEGVLSPAETLSRVLPAEGDAPPGGPEPWPIAALLALIALVVEWRVR